MQTRRDFLQGVVIAALAAATARMPAGREPVEIEIVDIEIDESVLRACVAFGGICKDERGRPALEMTLDMEQMMDGVTLVDSKGNRYRYRDFVRWLEEMGVDVDGE